MKEKFKKALKKVLNCLGIAIEKLDPEFKAEIDEFSKEAIEKLKIQVENYDYSIKLNAAVEFVMSKIKLPLWLKPFKVVVKNVIKSNAETFIEQIKDKVEEIKV